MEGSFPTVGTAHLPNSDGERSGHSGSPQKNMGGGLLEEMVLNWVSEDKKMESEDKKLA